MSSPTIVLGNLHAGLGIEELQHWVCTFLGFGLRDSQFKIDGGNLGLIREMEGLCA